MGKHHHNLKLVSGRTVLRRWQKEYVDIEVAYHSKDPETCKEIERAAKALAIKYKGKLANKGELLIPGAGIRDLSYRFPFPLFGPHPAAVNAILSSAAGVEKSPEQLLAVLEKVGAPKAVLFFLRMKRVQANIPKTKAKIMFSVTMHF